jgi:regulatory subunit for Cdc7p protein kinase
MRLLQPPEKPKTTNAPAELSYLLERERQSGLTYERDPTALRTDFLYFGRNSYFLLVEDFTGEHCPIAVKDYGRWKGKDKERGEAPWPTLCDAPGRAKKGWAEGKVSDSTGDSEVEDIEYDDRTEGEIPHPEEGVEQEGEPDDDEVIVVPERGKETGLRRTASMHNMGRAAQLKRDAEFLEGLPTNKSFTQRAYAAASGNSVSITSNVNSTTSFPYLAPGLGPPQKGMTRKLHQQVLTHRTFSKMKEGEGEGDVEQEKGKESQLKKAAPVLRKSKSTNTVRLGFREETKKPGYCENCKYKFSDFKTVRFFLPSFSWGSTFSLTEFDI